MSCIILEFIVPREARLASLHPDFSLWIVGVVITDMTKISGSNATVTPEESAAGILRIAESLNLTNSGQFWDFQGTPLPW